MHLVYIWSSGLVRMDLQHLRNFLVVVEQGSISHAAALIGISQPALTRQIQALQKEFDAPLFDRTRHGVVLTAMGETLAFEARRILASVRDARDAVDAASGKRGGRISVGTSLSLSRVFLPQLVLSAASDLPGVRLSVSEGYADDLCERLLDGRLDLAIADYRTPLPKLTARPLFRESIVAVGAAGVFASDAAITMRDFLHHDAVLAASTGRLRQMYERLAAKEGGPQGRFIEIDSHSALLHLIEAGGGVSLLPYSSVHHKVRAGLISVAELDPAPLRRQVALLVAKSRAANPASAAMEAIVDRLVARYAQEMRWDVSGEPGADR